MPLQGNFWSKLLPVSAQSSGYAELETELSLFKSILDALSVSSPTNAPGDALCKAVLELGANAGWLYTLPGDGSNVLYIQEQAGERATEEILRRAGHSLADQVFAARALRSKDGIVALPLIHQEEILGAAVFSFDKPNANIPAALGDYLGFALAYARLGEQAWREAAQRRQLEVRLEKTCQEECQQQQELALLNSLSAALVSGASREAILEKLCHELVETFSVTQAAAALLDESGETLHVVAEFVPPDRMPCVGMDIPVHNNPSSLYVIRMKTPLAVNDVQHDIRMTPIYELMKQRGVASMLILPLMVKERVIGTVGVDSAGPREYSEAEIALALRAAMLAAWGVAQQ